MVSSLVLDYKTLVSDHSVENSGLLDGPIANVGPLLSGFGLVVLLLCVRSLPSALPVICELFEEGRFEVCGLGRVSSEGPLKGQAGNCKLTVNVALTMEVEVADSTAEETDDAASFAASFASSTGSWADTTAAARAAVAKVVKRIMPVIAWLTVRTVCKPVSVKGQWKRSGGKEEVWV
jgi:hypothetical protein